MATKRLITADEIKRARHALNWTQERLAEEVGVQRTAVVHWENGIRNPSGSAVILLNSLIEKASRKKIRK